MVLQRGTFPDVNVPNVTTEQQERNLRALNSLIEMAHDPTSIEIFRLFAAAVRKCFRKVKGDYVGPNAVVLWNSGTRLTQAVQSPPEFDLVQWGNVVTCKSVRLANWSAGLGP